MNAFEGFRQHDSDTKIAHSLRRPIARRPAAIAFTRYDHGGRSALRNPVQRGHRFQRKADSNPVIADSR